MKVDFSKIFQIWLLLSICICVIGFVLGFGLKILFDISIVEVVIYLVGAVIGIPCAILFVYVILSMIKGVIKE